MHQSHDAQALAEQDPYQFQWWALSLVDARPTEQKKGPDRGIDGRIYFQDEKGVKEAKQIILSVKAGKLKAPYVRDLRGVVARENAQFGVLISFQKPTKAMRTEAAGAGFYVSPWSNTKHPKIQLLTVEELLNGKTIDSPKWHETTFKKAPTAKSNDLSTPTLPIEEP